MNARRLVAVVAAIPLLGIAGQQQSERSRIDALVQQATELARSGDTGKRETNAEILRLLEPVENDASLGDVLSGQIQFLVADAYFRLIDYAPALDHYRRALDRQRAAGDRAAEARTLRAIGQLHKNQGAYSDGLARAGEALAIYQSLHLDRDAALTFVVIGAIHDLMGDHRGALESFLQAVPALGAEASSQGGNLFNEIGITQKNLGYYDDALRSYEHALAIYETRGDTYRRLFTLLNIGVLYSTIGEHERGIGYSLQALALARQISERRGEEIILENLGEDYWAVGKRDRAIDCLQQALAAARQQGARSEENTALKTLGDIHAESGDLASARREYEEALRIQREIGERRMEASTLVSLADLAVREGHPGAAVDAARDALKLAVAAARPELEWNARRALARADAASGRPEAAVDELRAAARTINGLRAHVSADEDKIAFVDERQAVFHDLAALLVDRGEPAEALEWAEASRGRAFADLLADRDPSGTPAAADTATVQEIAETAGRLHASIVEYLVAERRLLIWVVSPDGAVHARSVDVARARLETLTKDVSDRVKRSSADAYAADALLARDLRQLDRFVLDPIVRWLPPSAAAPLVIVPHGPLAVVPFAALRDAHGRSLVDRYTLSFAPAVSVLLRTATPRQAPAPDRALLVADPVPPPGSGVQRLPGAREEGRRIAARLAGRTVRIYAGAEAKESRVKRDAGDFAILHFATHGLIAPDRPLASSLMLAAGEGEDGYLRVDEIFNMKLRARLVVLSGCSTGLGRLTGDGVLGLSRAFIYAGTPTVIVSQWDVSDRATAFLMDRFYASLRLGRSKAAALRLAELQTRKRYAHPALWAAFTLLGEPG